jgi:hypothetical protein
MAEHNPNSSISENINQKKDRKKKRSSFSYKFEVDIVSRYRFVSPYFLSFAILGFTSFSFGTLIFPLIIYQLISFNTIFSVNSFEFDFTSLAIISLSLISSITDLVYGCASRFSGKFTAPIESPRKGLIAFYTFNFPFLWMVFILIFLLRIDPYLQLTLIVIVFIIKLIVSGLASGLRWHLYYEITSSEIRSSQESYLNTLNLIVSVIGFSFLGLIIENLGLVESLAILFFLSMIAIILLLLAGSPESDQQVNSLKVNKQSE